MQQSEKNPNEVVREITQVLKDFYNDRIVPDALASGLDPVELFNRMVQEVVTLKEVETVESESAAIS